MIDNKLRRRSSGSLSKRRSFHDHVSLVKRICAFGHSVMTNFNCACPVIQRGQGSGFLSEGSSWLTACMSEQRRFWRDCADAQARLNLRCSHRRYVPNLLDAVHVILVTIYLMYTHRIKLSITFFYDEITKKNPISCRLTILKFLGHVFGRSKTSSTLGQSSLTKDQNPRFFPG